MKGRLVNFRFLALLIQLCLMGSADLLGQRIRTTQRDTVIVPMSDADSRIVSMGRIIITGNKVTRERIILRELTLKSGDTISTKLLFSTLSKDRNKIYNLRLFNTVNIRVLDLGFGQIDLLIEVSERFYTEPAPIFELADRNLNEWWTNYNADLSRINWGLRLKQKNFRGRNETLQLIAQFGFNRKFDLIYKIPNLDRQQKHGINFGFRYTEPRNLAYQTNDHVLSFLREKRSVRINRIASIGYTFRKSFYETHNFSADFTSSSIIDTVLSLNSNYFANGRNSLKYSTVSYSYVAEYRDVIAYPLKGYQFTFSITKSGLFNESANQLEINATYAKHWPLKNKFYLSNFSAGYLSTPTVQPYYFFSALGYREQVVRGYEIYVIEGPQFLLNKTTLKKRIFQRSWRVESMPLEQFRYFPLSIYLKGFTDLGYVTNYQYYDDLGLNTRLTGKPLLGAGAGIDFVTVYDFTFRIEYTLTREGTRGFFINLKKEF